MSAEATGQTQCRINAALRLSIRRHAETAALMQPGYGR